MFGFRMTSLQLTSYSTRQLLLNYLGFKNNTYLVRKDAVITYEIQFILGTNFIYVSGWDGVVINEESMKIEQILMVCFFSFFFWCF